MDKKTRQNNIKSDRRTGAFIAALSVAFAAAVGFRIYLSAKEYGEYQKGLEIYADFTVIPDEMFPDFDLFSVTEEAPVTKNIQDDAAKPHDNHNDSETNPPEFKDPAPVITETETADAAETVVTQPETAAAEIYTFSDFIAQLSLLESKYEDFYCWIRIKNTVINYPVVQADDNDFYLTRDIYGNKLALGAIFADYRCDSPDSARNTVIYGHRAKYSIMFNSLADFINPAFFSANQYVYLYLPKKTFVYEIYAAFKSSMYSDFNQTNFYSDEAFLEHINSFYGKAAQKRNVTFNASDRILTLSTCTNNEQSERYVVAAKLVSVFDN